MSDWEYQSDGLYDGELSILWCAKDRRGKLYLGVFEDWAEAIRRVPDMVKLLKDLLAEVNTGSDLDYHLREEGYADRIRELLASMPLVQEEVNVV